MQLISDLKNGDISKVKWAKIHLRGQSSHKPKQQKIDFPNGQLEPDCSAALFISTATMAVKLVQFPCAPIDLWSARWLVLSNTE